jgi:hypothetical protein
MFSITFKKNSIEIDINKKINLELPSYFSYLIKYLVRIYKFIE